MKRHIARSAGCVMALGAMTVHAQSTSSSVIDSAARTFEAGPFKLTAGPQDDGAFGAVLSGAGAMLIPALGHVPENLKSSEPFTARYGTVEFAADAGWSSKADALNQTTVSLQPGVTFVWLDGERPATQPERCNALVQEAEDLFKRLDAEISASTREALQEKLASITQQLNDPSCLPTPPSTRWAITFYPDLRYRFGEFEMDGQRFHANQLVTGLAARWFVPTLGRSAWFREWPRLSAGYYTVTESEDSTVPLPEGIDADTIKVSGKLALRLPFVRSSLATSPLHLDIEVTGSRPMTGDDREWEVMRQLQLSYDTGSKVLPALTYRSGKEQGFEFDKQVILGVVWKLAAND